MTRPQNDERRREWINAPPDPPDARLEPGRYQFAAQPDGTTALHDMRYPDAWILTEATVDRRP